MLHQRLLEQVDVLTHAPARDDARGAHVPTPPGPGRPRWAVGRAGLVDVNPIVRMLSEHRPFIDLDGDGRPDEVPDPEQAAPATRLVLSHGALEHGEVWYGRDDHGVAAVAVWLPPDADHLAADLHQVIAREIGQAVPVDRASPAHTPLRSIIDATGRLVTIARQTTARRVLVLLADAGREPEHRAELLADVLAPVVAEELPAGREVLAVTVDPDQVADLTALGFEALAAAPLGAASLWLGVLRPEALVERSGRSAGAGRVGVPD